ncbi:flagellar filament capping protein FliD [Psychrobacillus sp. FSL H8-0484]|uniref:flagellar filament capping protein FliD n=1 Tax=Psychrobacillus sp. FSL H8-0484 TaxID=2921390 RepID=UPI0030F750FE
MAGLRVGGLASGMDIDQIVKDLMKAERIPLDKMTQKKTTYEWKRDSYRAINTKLKTFDTYLFDNFFVSSNFHKKTVENSNSTLINATATGSASSSLSIDGVSQLANAARKVGNTVSTSSGGIATGSTKMSELGIAADTQISLKAIQANGTLATDATPIDIKATDSIDDVVAKINNSNAGVSALFENGKLSITAKNTGDIKGGAEVQITAGNDVFSALGMGNSPNLAEGGTNAIFQVNGISTERSTNTFMISGYNVTLNSTFNVKKTIEEQIARLATAIPLAEKDVENATAALTTATENAANQQTVFDNIPQSQKDAYSALVTDKAALKNALANISENDFIAFKDLPLNADGQIDNATIEASSISPEAKALLKGLSAEDRTTLQNLETAEFNSLSSVAKEDIKLDIANQQKTQAEQNLASKEQTRDQLKADYDAAVSQNNNTPQDTSVSPVKLTATADINSMVDKVKEFVSKYNELISGMNDQLKEKKYRDFPPLSDEQRKDMSEKEQELWDEKAKSGLLRSDDIIRSGLGAMRNTIYGKVGDGEQLIDTLAEMGITTSKVYSDGGQLVIDEDKLRKALTENPDQVVNTLTSTGSKSETLPDGTITTDTRGIAKRLRDSIKDFQLGIEKRAGKAGYTDQQYDIGKNLIDTNDRITRFQNRLKDVEARYWRQFTAMENAISKANQQSAMLMGQTS